MTTAQTVKSGIYKIANPYNGKFYIGSAVNLKSREITHFTNLKKNKHPNRIMQNSYNKYGEFNFEVLELVSDTTKLIEREQHYIDLLRPQYNIRKIAHSNKGLVLSDETKEKISKSMTGMKHSDETKSKCRIAKTGKLNPNYGKPARNRNIPMKEESKKKLSESKSSLSEWQIVEIKELLSQMIPQKEIAKKFNIHPSTVSKIKNGKRFIYVA